MEGMRGRQNDRKEDGHEYGVRGYAKKDIGRRREREEVLLRRGKAATAKVSSNFQHENCSLFNIQPSRVGRVNGLL